ncbi:MAG: hypothetical protein SXV54_19290, partial [Chloroflexota bacterium]|nr:hypothetical protein [Chloroflexota bacterium]
RVANLSPEHESETATLAVSSRPLGGEPPPTQEGESDAAERLLSAAGRFAPGWPICPERLGTHNDS